MLSPTGRTKHELFLIVARGTNDELIREGNSVQLVLLQLCTTQLVLRPEFLYSMPTALHGGQVPEDICLKPSCAYCMCCIFSAGLCTFAYTHRTRADIRQKYGLPAQPCGDCCVHFWWEKPTGIKHIIICVLSACYCIACMVTGAHECEFHESAMCGGSDNSNKE